MRVGDGPPAFWRMRLWLPAEGLRRPAPRRLRDQRADAFSIVLGHLVEAVGEDRDGIIVVLDDNLRDRNHAVGHCAGDVDAQIPHLRAGLEVPLSGVQSREAAERGRPLERSTCTWSPCTRTAHLPR